MAEVDAQSGHLESGARAAGVRRGLGYRGANGDGGPALPGDAGGASRFYPCFHYDAKASTRERQAGCENLLWVRDKAAPIGWRRVTADEYAAAPQKDRGTGNVHSTIKPIGAGADDGLMRWLVRLVTPPGGRVGDITLGSGGTGVAAQIEGHPFVGCDIDPGCLDIARARLTFWTPERHRLVLADGEALKAHERAIARERSVKAPPALEDLPLWAGRSA